MEYAGVSRPNVCECTCASSRALVLPTLYDGLRLVMDRRVPTFVRSTAFTDFRKYTGIKAVPSMKWLLDRSDPMHRLLWPRILETASPDA